MNGDLSGPHADGAEASAPLLPPAVSPRAAPSGSELGYAGELAGPFVPSRRAPDAQAAPAAPPLMEETAPAWAGDEAMEEWGAAPASDPRPLPAEEPPVPDDLPVLDAAGAVGRDPWDEPLPDAVPPAWLEPARAEAEPAPLPDWLLEEPADATAEWLIAEPETEPIPVELLGAVMEEPGEEPLPPEPPAPAAEAPAPAAGADAAVAALPMSEVAERLERIARSLRERGPAELLDPGAESDPLQLLITGYALGFAEAARAASERREGGAS